jgi:antitoxin (DNA-binding transcriptional repressor) of toxin-antitoxin stability system
MKTVTKKQLVPGFDNLANLAYSGETVLVTQGGKPWIKLVSAAKPKRGKSAAAFKSRLNRISPKPILGVPDVLQRLRG